MLQLVYAWLVGVYQSYNAWSHRQATRFNDWLSSHAPDLASRTRWTHGALAGDKQAQLGLGTILAAFVVVIAAFVVIIVVDEMNNALGDPSNSDLNNSSDSVLGGFASMVSLIEPLLLIGIGVVIISLIRRVQ